MTDHTDPAENTTGATQHPPGNLFVVSAPSGAGKSSLIKALLASDALLAVSVSHTTRAPRGAETNGREYHFVTEPAFRDMVMHGAFFEWAEVHGNLYGTSRAAIEQRLAQGDDLVLEVDWQGALQIKRLFPGAALVFILPPSWQALQERIQKRGEDAAHTIGTRLANARVEVAQAPHFDYIVVNGVFEQALGDLQAIVKAQRLKYPAQRRGNAAVFRALGLD